MTLTFKEFIKQFDKEDAIVLLEGKRKVPVAEREKLSALGKLLMQNTEKMIFRSGNAGGSDQLFFEGAASIDHTRLQVIVPYPTHRKKTNTAYETISLDDIILSAESEVINQSKLSARIMRAVILNRINLLLCGGVFNTAIVIAVDSVDFFTDFAFCNRSLGGAQVLDGRCFL